MVEFNRITTNIIDFFIKLKDPYLVARFQNYFGVYRLENDEKCKSHTSYVDSKNKEVNHFDGLNKTTIKSQLLNGNVNGVIHRRQCSCRNKCSATSPTTSDAEDLMSDVDSDNESSPKCRIDNLFWYYIFSFGASLGYEMFYASFFPFWFWNIDGAVGRRVVFVWVIIMYIGQALKDVIRWHRPSSPPVVALEPGYSQEYGMPSTHAMVGAAVPFSILFFTMHRYEYPFIVGLLLSTAWCILVCCSRLYMGMHTILDIIGGLVLVAVLMIAVIPLVELLDNFQLTYPYSPIITISVIILLLVRYPKSDRYSPARRDTTIIISSGAGLLIGSWLNFQLGIIRGPGLPPPYQILWPDYSVIGLALLRATIGILCIVATRAFFKSISYALLCYMLNLNPQNLKNDQKLIVEIPYKFVTYIAIGFVVTYISPFVFRLLNIERITMFTEV